LTDLHHEIAELEAEIADLAASAEQCRKTMIVAKIGMVAGGTIVLFVVIGVLRFGSVALLSSITAAIGGIVLYGSTKSTRDRMLARIRLLEQRRAEMIDDLRLRTVAPTR
jgi:hypothetical protein